MFTDDPRVRHRRVLPARPAQHGPWPSWVSDEVRTAFGTQGVAELWQHQSQAAEAIRAGEHVVLATGTASGKSLAYQLPITQHLVDGAGEKLSPATVLYLSPTKALAADQTDSWNELNLPGVSAAACDGDTSMELRQWIRRNVSVMLTNPDFLHHSLLPQHQRWVRFLRGLRYVVIDECHHYHGVFGAHVALVIRRLQRLCEHYDASPQFIFASATTAEPTRNALLLSGLRVREFSIDTSPLPEREVLFFAPGPPQGPGENVQPAPNALDAGAISPGEIPPGQQAEPIPEPPLNSLALSADLLAGLVADDISTLAFIPSRRGVEVVAQWARERFDGQQPSDPFAAFLDADLSPEDGARGTGVGIPRAAVDARNAGHAIAAYRGGYLAEERRDIEKRMYSGALRGLAATSALELGIDIRGLDAVVICGWPGRRSRFWQQAGRAGRAERKALIAFVASDNPLDQYIAAHPQFALDAPVEAAVLDPENPHLVVNHLCAAAAELPLREPDLERFGRHAHELVQMLLRRKLLRARPVGWFWGHNTRPSAEFSLRGEAATLQIVDALTGAVVGTASPADVDRMVHPGAIYTHQGKHWRVAEVSEAEAVCLVEPDPGDTYTMALGDTEIQIVQTDEQVAWGAAKVCMGSVEVTRQVHSYRRFSARTRKLIEQVSLDLPERTHTSTAVWWVLPDAALEEARLPASAWPGALHAAEHAAIGLLPLFAGCDRWDIGGVSIARHPQTESPTVFVYDGHPGGAGFAQRGFEQAAAWWQATLEAIVACPCESGCPLCIYSPKCGNGNEPLDKAAAISVLQVLLKQAASSPLSAQHSDATGQPKQVAAEPHSPKSVDLREPEQKTPFPF